MSSSPRIPASANFRYETLDHWRGLAAFGVVVAHSCYPVRNIDAGNLVRILAEWSFYGTYGVHIFFVVSGYCVSVKAVSTVSKGKSATSFLRDRLLRIFPAYWLACVAAIAIALAGSPFSNGSLSASLPFDNLGFISDVLLCHPYLNRHPVLGVSWTLVFEVGFYVLLALGICLTFRTRRWSPSFALGGGAAIAGVLGAGTWLPTYILTYWSEFYSGIAVFVFVRFQGQQPLKAFGAATIPPGLAILAIASHGLDDAGSILLAAIFAMVLMALKPYDRRIASWRSLRWLGICGTFSYSLYLIHQPLTTRAVNGMLKLFASSPLGVVLSVVIGVAIGVFAGAAFYRLCELPLEKWRHRLETAKRENIIVQASP